MRKYAMLFIVLSMVLLVFESCKKDEEITCNLDAHKDQLPEDMTITFTASKTGDGVINSLSYKTSEGDSTITNPSLPWTQKVDDAKEGTSVSITAQGTVKDGSLTVAFSGEGGDELGSDGCSSSDD